jgi:hypothetical protein
MSEKGPEPIATPEISEEEINRCCESAMTHIKGAFDLTLNNFEFLRLRNIAKEILARKADQKEESTRLYESDPTEFRKLWSEKVFSSYSPVMEVTARFFMNEYGIHPENFAKDEGSTTEDFKKYLKVLQKKHLEGEE